MLSKKRIEKLTEFAGVRQSYGLRQSEVAKAIGIAESGYSLYENGKRVPRKERAEELFYQIHHACHNIIAENKRKAEDLKLNTYSGEGKTFNNIEDQIKDELAMELHYVTLTEDLFKDILMKYIFKGKTVVNAAAHTGVDEDVLKDRLDKNGIPYIMGDKYDVK